MKKYLVKVNYNSDGSFDFIESCNNRDWVTDEDYKNLDGYSLEIAKKYLTMLRNPSQYEIDCHTWDNCTFSIVEAYDHTQYAITKVTNGEETFLNFENGKWISYPDIKNVKLFSKKQATLNINHFNKEIHKIKYGFGNEFLYEILNNISYKLTAVKPNNEIENINLELIPIKILNGPIITLYDTQDSTFQKVIVKLKCGRITTTHYEKIDGFGQIVDEYYHQIINSDDITHYQVVEDYSYTHDETEYVIMIGNDFITNKQLTKIYTFGSIYRNCIRSITNDINQALKYNHNSLIREIFSLTYGINERKIHHTAKISVYKITENGLEIHIENICCSNAG